MEADGSNPVHLTTGIVAKSPRSWSPDGKKIAFASSRERQSDIYVMDADGSHPVRLTSDPSDESGPAWSPDGSQLAFAAEKDGNRHEYDGSLAWSPDGKRLVFISGRDGYDAVFMESVDGGPATRLTTQASLDLRWSR